MAPPVGKKKKLSSTAENQQQQPLGSIVTPFGRRQSVRLAKKMNNRTLRKIWICNDVCMDILPFFDRVQLGLKLALISPRFDGLVDTHFDSGKTELNIRNEFIIRKNIKAARKPIFAVDEHESVQFPMPDRPLPNRIRFPRLTIAYIDHHIIEFLRSNQQIWDKGTNLDLYVRCSHATDDQQPIWDVFVREIWPIFAQNIRHFQFSDTNHLDNLRLLISPTILSDVNPNSIYSGRLVPELLGDDGPNSTAGQALGKWLHTPRKDGQPKRLTCCFPLGDASVANEWINNFKKAFLRATTTSSTPCCYFIHFLNPSTPHMAQFELTNEATQEMLTLEKHRFSNMNILKRHRCSIGEKTDGGDLTASKRWDFYASNTVIFNLCAPNCIGPLSPPAAKSGSKQ